MAGIVGRNYRPTRPESTKGTATCACGRKTNNASCVCSPCKVDHRVDAACMASLGYVPTTLGEVLYRHTEET